ncbi:MAG: MaoC family dehydratase [Georgfuchsia sp.]
MNPLGGYDIEDLQPGMSASFGKTVTEADILLFAGVSGDINAIHLNEEFAATTIFGGRVAHGMLTAGFISAVLGNKLPGPGTVYMAQNIRFRLPVRIEQTVTATVTVREIFPDKCRVILDTVCTVLGKVVADGEATVMVTSSKNVKV